MYMLKVLSQILWEIYLGLSVTRKSFELCESNVIYAHVK